MKNLGLERDPVDAVEESKLGRDVVELKDVAVDEETELGVTVVNVGSEVAGVDGVDGVDGVKEVNGVNEENVDNVVKLLLDVELE
ncbi:hypothetical protein PMKS-004219 [Pichia membranifaciens]|uniref:Uncharacterized protein n=1 Tax=Pichia membranifaciens TaxID=4926 RepID=A0A1Q2YM96_9ASCO|nr:hypothetical protein PMKS-004219 [Pichia membranifaciens]